MGDVSVNEKHLHCGPHQMGDDRAATRSQDKLAKYIKISVTTFANQKMKIKGNLSHYKFNIKS